MEIQILLILSCLIGTIWCNMVVELAPVSARERRQGYSCKSKSRMIGLMKEGEKRSNVPVDTCNQIICGWDEITVYDCGVGMMETPTGICRNVPQGILPYPDCCNIFECN